MTATSIRPTAARTCARYPAPRRSRRLYDAQVYQQPQQYYDNRGYARNMARRRSTRRGRITSRAGCSPIRTTSALAQSSNPPVLDQCP